MLKTVGNPSTRSGDQTILDGNLVIGTAGKGIDFSSDPSAPGMSSELFDDYEEGTWTPVIAGTTSAGVGTYTVQVGKYTKVGNRVFISCQITWSAHTGTGNMRLSRFPFTPNSTANNNSTLSILANNITYGAGQLSGWMATGSTNFNFVLQASAAAYTSVAIDTAGNMIITGSYEV